MSGSIKEDLEMLRAAALEIAGGLTWLCEEPDEAKVIEGLAEMLFAIDEIAKAVRQIVLERPAGPTAEPAVLR